MKVPTVLLFLVVQVATASVNVLSDGRVSFGAHLWANCVWRQAEVAGYSDAGLDFYRKGLVLSFDASPAHVVRGRVSMDVGGVSLQDAYADFHWLSGIGLRVGQFKPPIGLEAGLEEHELKLVERSLLQRYWKPADPWDIGIAVRFERAAFDITGAIVNGSGRNSARDGNRWKDVCAQLNVRAFSSRLPVLSLRTYYGRVGGDGNEFVTFAAAVSAGVAGGEVLAELQHARVGASRRPSVHVQASRLLAPWVEVAGRFQVEVQPEDRYDGGLTGGLNLKPLGETLTIMLNYNYWRQASQHPQLRVSEHKVYIQVQLGL